MAIQEARAQIAESNIYHLLVTMGGKVDESVSRAITGLLHTHSHVIAGMAESSVVIQELEHMLDQAVFAALETGALEAAEIKQVTSAVNIGKDLSRLGKLASNVGRKVTQMGKHNEHEDFSRLQPLAIAVSHLCRQTLRSLARLDPVLARNAAQGGASVDAYRDYVLRGLSRPEQHVADDQDLHLIFASRCLEQLADNAIHLAENLVIFLQGQSERKNCQSLAS